VDTAAVIAQFEADGHPPGRPIKHLRLAVRGPLARLGTRRVLETLIDASAIHSVGTPMLTAIPIRVRCMYWIPAAAAPEHSPGARSELDQVSSGPTSCSRTPGSHARRYRLFALQNDIVEPWAMSTS
jgi:hypothetical protein